MWSRLLPFLLITTAAWAQLYAPGVPQATPNLDIAGSGVPTMNCTVTQRYFRTDATPGQNIYGCTAANVWTLQSGSASIIERKEYAAARCQNTIAGAGFSSPATGAPTADCVTGTNVLAAVLQFLDSGTATVQDHFRFPASVTGIALTLKWRTAATTGSVVWQLATACVADGETMDPAWNAAQTVTDAAKGTSLQTNDATIANVTTTGCATGAELFFKILRDPTHAGDDLGATAELISAVFEITRAL